MATARQVGVDPSFQDHRVELVEPGAGGAGGRSGVEIGEGRSPPEGERRFEPRRSISRVAFRKRRGRIGHERLEPTQVDAVAFGSQPIAARLRFDATGTDDASEPRHMHLERVMCAGWRIVSPDLVDQPVGRDGLADVQHEEGEDRPLAATTDRDWAKWSDDFQGT